MPRIVMIRDTDLLLIDDGTPGFAAGLLKEALNCASLVASSLEEDPTHGTS
jgi:hypothetical protein